jgi:hypothetical protein
LTSFRGARNGWRPSWPAIFVWGGLAALFAELYDVQTKSLLQAVKRNVARFPPDFCFQLTADELARSRSQIVTLKNGLREASKPGRARI